MDENPYKAPEADAPRGWFAEIGGWLLLLFALIAMAVVIVLVDLLTVWQVAPKPAPSPKATRPTSTQSSPNLPGYRSNGITSSAPPLAGLFHARAGK